MDKERILKECILRNSPIGEIDIDINAETNFVEDLMYSSLSYIALIVDLEETFNFEFDMDALQFDNFNYMYFYNEICQ